MKYDLEERAAKFGENTIAFLRLLRRNDLLFPLVNQLMRSSTSIGANYMEANQASSKKDFLNKIRICQKEANESKHWLRMIAVTAMDKKDECRKLWIEAHQLTLIFAKISRTCSLKNKGQNINGLKH